MGKVFATAAVIVLVYMTPVFFLALALVGIWGGRPDWEEYKKRTPVFFPWLKFQGS